MSLLYVDRSRYELGTKRCMMARYHEYEREGTGIRAIAQSLYPTTGRGVHDAMQKLMEYAAQHGALPPREEARKLVTTAHENWESYVRSHGLREVAPEHLEFVVNEQGSLVEGFFWCFYRGALETILEDFQIVCVENEEHFVYSCTCGLGDFVGTADDHEAKACEGICFTSRPDFTGARKLNGALCNIDFKTTGGELETRDNEHILQVIFGGKGVERRLGQPCTEHYFIGLHKGARRPNKEGIKEQASPLCYGYYRQPLGPFDEGHWQPTYEYNGKRPTKDHIKTPVWGAHFPSKPEGMSNSEWVCMEILTLEDCRDQVSLLGPMPRPDYLVKPILDQVSAHEREWKQRREAIAAGTPVDEVVAASWDCYNFFGGNCEFIDLCHRNAPEWQTPLYNTGRWERRDENHPLARRNYEPVKAGE